MKHTIGAMAMFSLLLTGLLLPMTAQAGYVVKDGKPVASICVPAGQPMQVAVDELRTYIKKMSGAELSVVTGVVPATAEARIVLEVKPGTFSPLDGSDEGFTIEEKGNEVRIAGNSEVGTLCGVYQYLGELGVRWYEPGEIGENVPERKTITIGVRKKDYAPAFATRSPEMSNIALDWSNGKETTPGFFGSSVNNFEDYKIWRRRNRLHGDRNMGGGLARRRLAADHSLTTMALKGASLATEPERFPLVTGADGRQTRRDKWAQICFSNEKNVQTAIASCLQYFQENPNMITAPMALDDCTGICECDNCKKVGGNPPYNKERRCLTFMNKVAKGVAEKMPGHGIGIFFPYYELQTVPPGMKLEPNLVCLACRAATWDAAEENAPYLPFTKEYADKLEAVRAAGGGMAFYDYVLSDCPQPLSIIDALAKYRALGVKHCGTEIMNRNEQLSPLLWVMAQYLWDGTGNPRDLLKTFCTDYYGAKAGADVFAIQEKLDQNSRSAYHMIYGGLNDCSVMLPEAFIVEGLATLERDIAQASGKEKIRLERFRDTFEMFGRMARIYRLYCQALNERAPERVKAFQAACDDFEQFWNDRHLAETCGHDLEVIVKNTRDTKIDLQAAPKGRKELADKTVLMRELFAGSTVPQNIPNFFLLPEVWKFRVDFEDNGLKNGWEKPDYDDTKGWQGMSTWDCYENQGYDMVDGRFWYRLAFQAPQFPAGKKIWMRVGSLDDNGEVYINGHLAAKPNSIDMWETSYAFDVTPFLQPGQKNVIAVRGYDSFGAGGLWRPCALYTE